MASRISRKKTIRHLTDLNIVASFDRRGNHIYTGNAKGRMLVLKCPGLETVASFRVTQGTTSATAVKSLEFAPKGDCFLMNTADRIIRVYNSNEVITCGKDGEPEPVQKLQDLVNKTMWKKCCFSGDGEYICAGSARQHALYIWEKSIGNLVKILHGTKGELLLDVVWHPVRPIIASISSGVVSVWAQNQVENWSAFAPDFKELDENVEYEERESEFDLADEDKSVDLKPSERNDDDLEVDVTTVDQIAAFYSSDEEADDPSELLHLPIAPEVEDPEEAWAQGDNADDSLNSGGGETRGSKRSLDKENTQPSKKKRTKTYDINLEDAPTDEVHPMMSSSKSKERNSGGKKPSARSKGYSYEGKPSKGKYK